MAIDTEDKRRSVQAYTLGLVRPLADSAVEAPDRATAAWYYSGLTYNGTPPAGSTVQWITRYRRRRGR